MIVTHNYIIITWINRTVRCRFGSAGQNPLLNAVSSLRWHDYNVKKKCIITCILFSSYNDDFFMSFVQKMGMEIFMTRLSRGWHWLYQASSDATPLTRPAGYEHLHLRAI